MIRSFLFSEDRHVGTVIMELPNYFYFGLRVTATLEQDHVSPIPLFNVGKYRISSNKKG